MFSGWGVAAISILPLVVACGPANVLIPGDEPLGDSVLYLGDAELFQSSLEHDGRKSLGPALEVRASPNGERVAIKRPAGTGQHASPTWLSMDLSDGSTRDLGVEERWVESIPGVGKVQTWAVSDVAWAADGRHLAYRTTTTPEFPGGFGIVDPDGSNQRELFSSTWEEHRTVDWYQWAPDGRHLAYVTAQGEIRELHVASSDASDDIVIAEAPGAFLEPPVIPGAAYHYALWHPDGAALLYFSSANAQVHVADADGRNARLILSLADFPGLTSVEIMSWSPTGGHLTVGTNDAFFIMASDGAMVQQRWFGEEGDHTSIWDMTWSPATEFFAYFDRYLEHQQDLRVFHVSNIDRRVAPGGRGMGGAPVLSGIRWDPRGELLTYTSSRASASGSDTSSEGHMIRAEGTNHTVTPGGEVEWSLAADRFAVAARSSAGATVHLLDRAGRPQATFEASDVTGLRFVHGDRWILDWSFTELRARRPDGAEPRTLWTGTRLVVP